ncbi:MAG: PD-(D/E)XK nuclease family protein, partial [Bacteroidales bacterium]|nr:PD-(D/E)XK nuclease family protein [Bacteroidales bacterium]
MIPFLQQVAAHWYAAGQIDGTCFVFPNRRSLVFFRKYLCGCVAQDNASRPPQERRPLLLPDMLTINDFFYRIADADISDRVTLLLELYDSYKTLNPKAEPLDDFIFWGDVILNDFSDVDKYLVDPHQLFTNVGEFRAMQDNYSYLTEAQRAAIVQFVSHFRDGGKL